MAQLKDLIVSGVTRCLGKLYASELIGKFTGTAELTGTSTAPTVSDPTDQSTNIATTAFVQAAIQKTIEDLFENGTFVASGSTAQHEDGLVTAGTREKINLKTSYPVLEDSEEEPQE